MVESYTLSIHMEQIRGGLQVESTISGVAFRYKTFHVVQKLNELSLRMKVSSLQKLIWNKLSPEIQLTYQEIETSLMQSQVGGISMLLTLHHFLVWLTNLSIRIPTAALSIKNYEILPSGLTMELTT